MITLFCFCFLKSVINLISHTLSIIVYAMLESDRLVINMSFPRVLEFHSKVELSIAWGRGGFRMASLQSIFFFLLGHVRT